MQRSNTYIFTFIVALTMICAVLLSLTNESLKDKQAANVAFEKRKFILTTFMGAEAVAAMQEADVNSIYDAKVKTAVVDFNGNEVDMAADKVAIEKEYKKPLEERTLPVYTIQGDAGLEFVVLPTYGFGLWDNIWGYVALEKDMKTIKGVVFDHKGETPGLGARITTDEIQSRYVGKSILDDKGELVSVTMMKGENGGGEKSIAAFEGQPNKVDGMSGATLTGNGINDMLGNYFKAYNNYFKKLSVEKTALN
ncbi:MAG: NADH:ubiquinone reductase (Na(+)-transporting) subunit C [Bacteroidota bacterium]|nr:NADH:ubiquinone reductase (Na(+)-transporting) subunit C [Bacteroidota bacterium]MDX5431084.1 NADH:ubiquinone reductase (Na(+)-transporting) subunit C [Bacteroidota bacterium]MDX5469838.1 NADH:ubiquinone reductase (Na(+)-transporting) subunit C [Bacteroidota bacterium]